MPVSILITSDTIFCNMELQLSTFSSEHDTSRRTTQKERHDYRACVETYTMHIKLSTICFGEALIVLKSSYMQ